MIIYQDIITGDEVFSDSFDFTEEDDIVYSIETKNIVVSEESYLEANVDEDAEEGAKAADNILASETVNNLEHGYRLSPTIFNKKSYMAHLKQYMAAIKAHLQKENPDRVAPFMKAAQVFAKKILSNFDEYQFYTTESMNPDALVLIRLWKEGSSTPTFYVWKDGLIEYAV